MPKITLLELVNSSVTESIAIHNRIASKKMCKGYSAPHSVILVCPARLERSQSVGAAMLLRGCYLFADSGR